MGVACLISVGDGAGKNLFTAGGGFKSAGEIDSAPAGFIVAARGSQIVGVLPDKVGGFLRA